jgi:transcription antitermination protein NusB
LGVLEKKIPLQRKNKALSMISRRNIRVKVMQTLYVLETVQQEVKPGEPEKILKKHFDQTRQLFIYLIYFLSEVCRYAETHAHNKASKHLPTEADRNINTKLAGNELLWKILEDPSYQKALHTDKPQLTEGREWIKKIYLQLIESPEYLAYVSDAQRDKKAEKDIIDFIFNALMLPNEDFISHLEDHYTNWDDDAEMMQGLVMNYLAKPGTLNLQEILSREKWQFALNLLKTVMEKQPHTLELITQKLKNWDAERIAALDMILMQMGVCEFLYFETIPPKVTINEYIDLAKEYSTPQSGHFVNGILDNIHKELVQQDKLHKVNFKASRE